ncbi:MAG: septal ring lytic transglycosylase RlpA family protein [Rectinemataceae bacterium]
MPRSAPAVALVAFALAAFAAGASAQTAILSPSAAGADTGGFSGIASWYGPEFAGRTTSSGEVYDPAKLTAAHRSLPFGSYVLVRNLDNGSSVIVRVNDRGPFAAGRVIDLSEAAARLIGMLPTGTAPVSCSLIAPEEALAWKGGGMDGRPPPPIRRDAAGAENAASAAADSSRGVRHFRIQVASYASEANARTTLIRLQNSGLSPSIEQSRGYFRVILPDLSPEDATRIRGLLGDMGYRSLLVTSWTEADK